jgi:D-sedoheptulose 7-phosphate isomerase
MGETTSDFLYPFLEPGRQDPGPLLADLSASARSKADESSALRTSTLDECRDRLDAAASDIAVRLESGGRLLTMGNGGSSTDADSLAALFSDPPDRRPLAARSLVADQAVITALANDVGYELVFSRQVIAFGGARDVLVGFSTSGDSANLLRAFAEGRRRGLLTVGLAGSDGGEMAASPDLDHLLLVRSSSIHRIQETQAALGLSLWRRVREILDAPRDRDTRNTRFPAEPGSAPR